VRESTTEPAATEGSLANFGIVHHYCAHADEGEVVDFAAVEGDVMAYGYIVAYLDCRFFIEGVEHRAVLDVDAVADGYSVYIAAEHGVEPQTTVFAYSHITDY